MDKYGYESGFRCMYSMGYVCRNPVAADMGSSQWTVHSPFINLAGVTMKAIVMLLVFMLFVSTVGTVDVFAKPAQCVSALRQCANMCRELYGDWNPLTDACQYGCAIGYLFC
jgi:hypothetical protein